MAFERFTRTADLLEGEYLVTSPRLRSHRYRVAFRPDGTVRSYELSSAVVVEAPGAAPPIAGTVTFAEGILTAIVRRGSRIDTTRLSVTGAVVPNAVSSWGLFGLAIEAARRHSTDSTIVGQYGLGARQVTHTAVSRRGDSLAVDFFETPMMVALDEAGRPRGVDGGRTTLKVVARRVEGLDLEARKESFAARERAGAVAGPLSTRDTVVTTVRGVAFWLDYGRPAKRGRVLLGGVVPYGEVWRTGANAATQIRFDRPIEVAGRPVPAGIYTLWTLPTAAGVQLIINRQVGQWGTSYDPAQDLIRVDAMAVRLEQPVERFTITIAEAGADRGELRLDWDRTRWVVPFRVP